MTVPVVLVEAVRTPIGKFNRSLTPYSAVDLGAIAIKGLLEKIGLNPQLVSEVLMGCAVQGGLGQAPARQAAIKAGIPFESSAVTINMVCGSSLRTIMLAAQMIMSGDDGIFVAGGMESMTNAPYFLKKARHGYIYDDSYLHDMMVHDGLKDPFYGFIMGESGDVIAERYGITREEADRFALRSHQLAARATEKGYFTDHVISIVEKNNGTTKVVLDRDEGIRPDTSLEKLARLKPAFRENGVTTPGNASQISDGAAAALVMSEKRAEKLGLDPKARIVAFNTVGIDSARLMEAPIFGVRDLLKKTDLTIDDFDLVEHNEAFASASVAVQQALEVPDQKFNVNGGAVALGHPIGASASRIVADLVAELHRRKAHRGVVTLCLGGGNAVSMIFETDF